MNLVPPNPTAPAPDRVQAPAGSFPRQLLGLRFAPANQADPTGYDSRLDGLRGFAACSVMAVHGFGYDGPSPLSATNEYVRHLHMSRAAVLLFFVLSGYVIGLTNRRPFSMPRAREYLGRRFLRIVPIYLLALAAGALLEPSTTWPNFFANAFFLQNAAWHISPLNGNLPVWSLHNEMVYYLGFVLLWLWRPRAFPFGLALFALTAADWYLGGFVSVPGGWAAGALFWLAGLLLAWHPPEPGASPLLGFLLLGYATNHLWPGIVLLNGLGVPYAGSASIWVSDLALLPVAVVIFVALLQRDFPGLRVLRMVALAIPVATCLLLLKMGRLGENVPWRMAGIATALALPLLVFERAGWGQAFFKLFRPLGRISFGLYLFHVPASALVTMIYPWQRGSLLNYLGGIACWVAVTGLVAYLCELKLQPVLTAFYREKIAGPR